jgi:hypothetical protein
MICGVGWGVYFDSHHMTRFAGVGLLIGGLVALLVDEMILRRWPALYEDDGRERWSMFGLVAYLSTITAPALALVWLA